MFLFNISCYFLDLTAEKEEEAEEMRQKWSEEREEMERETLELRSSIDARVEAKVEVRFDSFYNLNFVTRKYSRFQSIRAFQSINYHIEGLHCHAAYYSIGPFF